MIKLVIALAVFVASAGVAHAADHCATDKRPYRIAGNLTVDGHRYRIVSGGKGWSIPYGDWEVTPDEVGKWGRRHGAMGLNHDDGIPDPQLHRDREGIEIHAWSGDTAGCIGVQSGYRNMKKLTLALIRKEGHAWLHVWPCRIEITAQQL